MKKMLASVAVLTLCTGGAVAAGVERSAQSVGILFETGRYAEFSFASVKPKVSGTQAITSTATGTVAGAQSGDMADDYTLFGLGYKQSLGENIDLAFVVDTPIGANSAYAAGSGYIFGIGTGSTASITSRGYNILGRYKIDQNFSVIGGARIIKTQGEANLFNGYKLSTKAATDVGYVIGVAYERPEIAMRVALTYNSAVTHEFDATETPGSLTTYTEFETTIPQSLNLEFQSGVAKDTLLFGSVRWVEWSKFNITPEQYLGPTFGNGFGLVELNNNTTTFNVGLGRKLNDTWSGAVTASYEKSHGGFSGNLSPTDGKTSIGVAATYTMDKVKFTGGLTYAWLGDAKTEAPAPSTAPERTSTGVTLGDFADNSALAIGFKVGYSF